MTAAIEYRATGVVDAIRVLGSKGLRAANIRPNETVLTGTRSKVRHPSKQPTPRGGEAAAIVTGAPIHIARRATYGEPKTPRRAAPETLITFPVIVYPATSGYAVATSASGSRRAIPTVKSWAAKAISARPAVLAA